MPFHVEIRHSFRRAWAFNLSEEKLRRDVLEPWQAEREVEFGDRRWDSRQATLKVLEGPQLEAPELAHGQGWHNAERSATDVTERLLGPRTSGLDDGKLNSVGVLAERSVAREAVTELLGQLGVPTIEWAALRARLLAGASTFAPAREAGALAAVLVVENERPASDWLFDAGLALGALGSAAIVVRLGDAPAPPALRDLASIRLEPGEPARALAERLRLAGA